METKKRDFIIKHFGCYTTIDGKQVLTSLANASRVPIEDFWNIFSGDAEKYFEIRQIDGVNELSLILDERTRKNIERELDYDHIAKMNVGFGFRWYNYHSIRCYLEDISHNRKEIPFIFVLNDAFVQGYVDNDGLHKGLADAAGLIPVNSGATAIIPENHGGYFIKGGKFGCINKTGRVQIPLVYDHCIIFTNPNIAIAEKDGKKILVNKWGEYIHHSYDDLVSFYGDYCLAIQNGKYGIIDYGQNVIVSFEYNKIICNRSNNNATLYLGTHCGLFDLNQRKFLVDIAYDAIVEHRDNTGVFSVCINNKWGLIDRNNFVIVPIEYEYVTTEYGMGLVSKNSKFGIVDKILSSDHEVRTWEDISFNECVPCIYDEVYNTEGEVSHSPSLFWSYRLYFIRYKGDSAQIDCYYTLEHRKNGYTNDYTYELLTSLYCEKKNIKNTIVTFDAMQKNEQSFSDE